jgi:hypothetical protein
MIRNLLVVFNISAALLDAAAPFSFAVYRTKLTRDEPGQLEISESGVRYHADKKKTSITLPFADIRRADVSDPSRITLETFDITKRRLGGRKVFSFRLRRGGHDAELAQFLAEHLKRPVVGAYPLPNDGDFEISAYHRRLLSGAHGKLIIGSDGIRFLSDKAKEPRTWLYRDIETIGNSGPFHFRVTTYAETFSFDLKERLPEEVYRLAWQKVYRLEPRTKGP